MLLEGIDDQIDASPERLGYESTMRDNKYVDEVEVTLTSLDFQEK